jgi:hypothetical protein
LLGSDENGKREEVWYTYNMVKPHVGLRTNASDWTRAQFMKNVTRRLVEEAERRLSREKEEAA